MQTKKIANAVEKRADEAFMAGDQTASTTNGQVRYINSEGELKKVDAITDPTNQFYLTDPDTGNKKLIDLTLPKLKTADNLLLAIEYISDYKGKLTKIKNDAVEAFDLGIIDQSKVMEVLTTVDKIQTALKKPKQAKKPKQPKFIPIKFGKAKKISGLTKSKKLKLVRPKKFK